MKTLYKAFFFIILIPVYQSCSKSFLEAPPRDMLPRDEVVNSVDACEQMLGNVYLLLSGAYNTYADIYPELAADNIKPVIGANNLNAVYTWTQLATNSSSQTSSSSENLNGYSFAFYNIIRTCNYLVETTPKFSKDNPRKADYVIGSALTARAYSYLMLANMFAQPYNYTSGAAHPGLVYSTSADWTDKINGRSSVADVYKNIIADLERAIPLFHNAPANTTLRFNKNLPAALLSRAALYSGNYTLSLEYAQKCIADCPLLTIDKGYPDEIYKDTVPAESEVFMHMVPLSSNQLGYNGTALFSNFYYRLLVQFTATADLAALLTANPNDVRKNWVTESGGSWQVTKFAMGAIGDIMPPHLSYFQPVARVSEMYLNAAESSFHLQQEDKAREYLTRLIQRADPAAPAFTGAGSQLLARIKEERRKELAFEGFRLYDLQRWKQDIVRTDPLFPQYNTLTLPNNKAIAPLPLQDLTGEGVTQNPGY